MAPKAGALTAEERADAREARKADNRAKHRAKHDGQADPQQESVNAWLQRFQGAAPGISIVVLQVLPQRRGELGVPAHVEAYAYSQSLTEEDLKELVRQSGCAEPGTFELRAIRTGGPGPGLIAKVLGVVRVVWRWKVDPTLPAATDPLTDVDRFARTAVALKSLSGMGVIDAAMVTALKPQPYQPPPTNPVMDQVMQAVLARLVAPPADPIATLSTAVAFIDQARGPVAPPTNPMETLKGIGEMLTAVKAFTGGLGSETAPTSSPWIEVLRIVASAFGPLVPVVAEGLSMARTQRAQQQEIDKRKTLALFVNKGYPLPVAAQLAGVTLPPPAFGAGTPGRQEPESPVATGGPSAGPFGKFFGAIVEGDDRAFPAIAETIAVLPGGMGGKILDALATDPNALAVIRGKIEAEGAREFFGELFLPGSDVFFGRFAAWLRAQNDAGQDGAS